MRKIPASAPMTPATAPKPVAQPLGALVTFRLSESEAAKYGLLDRWQAAYKKREARAAHKAAALTLLNQSVSELLVKAQCEEWSQRKLSAKIQIPETTFRRIKAQQVDPFLWLPKLQAALAKLKPS